MMDREERLTLIKHQNYLASMNDSSLSQVLAQEREKAIHRLTISNDSQPSTYILLWGLIVIQALAFLMALSVVGATVPVNEQTDMASELNISQTAPENHLPQPVQPNFNTRLLKPSGYDTSQAGETSSVVKDGLRLKGLEITQGIQVFREPENPRCQPDPRHRDHQFCNNSVPLVAGRHTLLRVYLSCQGHCPATDSHLQLRLIKDGLERAILSRPVPAEWLAQVSSLTPSDQRLSLDHSINFEFMPPPAWMTGQVTFELATLSQTIPDKSIFNIHHLIAPNKKQLASLTTEFTPRRTLKVAYLPIEYQGHLPAELDNADYWLKRMYPVPEVEYFRLPMPDLVWEAELNKNDILRKLLYTYWLYAIYHPVQHWPDQLFGWLPAEYYNGGASDPFWCPDCAGPHSSRVGFGGLRPELDIGGPRILVHEIAHNLGAQHAWSPTKRDNEACFRAEGVDIRVDPRWPYPETPFIQEVGIDLYSDPPVIYPPSRYDMMAYCTQPWISPYTYRTLFDSPLLQPQVPVELPRPNYQPYGQSNDTGALLVSGDIYPDGRVSKLEVIQLAGDKAAHLANNFSPPTTGDYCLTVQDYAGQSVGHQCFEVGFLNLETGLPSEEAGPFFVTLPHIPADTVGQVILSHQGRPIKSIQASNTAPTVTLDYPTGGQPLDGQQTVRWQAADADGDPLYYDLLYSPDAGQSWLPLAVRRTETRYTFHSRQLPPSEQALLRVTATDGFHTAVAESATVFSLNAGLANSISLQGPANVAPGETFEINLVANEMGEPGLATATFSLNFDPDLLQFKSVTAPAKFKIRQQQLDNGQLRLVVQTSEVGQGNIELVTMRFMAQAKGRTQLHLSNFMAQSPTGEPLPIAEMWELWLHIP